MKLLHNVGIYPHSNYNTRAQIKACREQLSFDGVYNNLWTNRDLLLGRQHKTILFVMWEYVGKNNSFDAIANNLPLEQFCDWAQLDELCNNYNCELGSHSWSHPDLTQLSDDQICQELNIPFQMRNRHQIKYFAYPYGLVNDRVANLVKQVGYQDAWSVDQGNGGPFQRKRSYL